MTLRQQLLCSAKAVVLSGTMNFPIPASPMIHRDKDCDQGRNKNSNYINDAHLRPPPNTRMSFTCYTLCKEKGIGNLN